MKADQISGAIETSKNKIIKNCLMEINKDLAELHNQISILEEEDTIVFQEYKNTKKHIEESRNLLKLILFEKR